jgi:hypothetical protein
MLRRWTTAEKAGGVAPLRAALATTVLVMILILSGGGVWLHVWGQDLHAAFLPKYVEAARALFREGRLPLWNPWEFCGAPLFAVTQGLVLYLPTPVLFALLPPYAALQALYAFNVLVLAWGTVVCLREHGIAPLPAVLAVLVTVNGVFRSFAMVGFDHPNFLGSVAWIPWILVAWQRTVTRGPRPWLGLLGLAVAAQWLAGYPDFPIDTSVLLGVVALVSSGGTVWRRVGWAIAGFALGSALAAVQLLPLAEAVDQSLRAASVGSYAELRLKFGVFSSGMFGELVVARFGLAALALALAALWPPVRSRLAWAAALLFALCAVDPPLDVLYRVPPFAGVRFPLGWTHIAALFVGFLVAAALQSAILSRSRWVRLAVFALGVVVATRTMWMIASAVREPGRVGPDYALLAERLPALQAAQSGLPGRPRLITPREADSGMLVRDRLFSASGYDPTMPPRRMKRLMRGTNDVARVAENPNLAALLGIGLVASPRSFAPQITRYGFVPVAKLPPNEVLLYRPPVPRARIVHYALAAKDEQASFAMATSAKLDHSRTVVLETADPLPALAEPAVNQREEATIVRDEPERVEVAVELAAPGFLVLGDTWYPGWIAEVDGVTEPILRADYGFRAVSLAPGKHLVTFRYAPASLQHGLWITLVAVLVTGALLLAPRPTPAAT